MVATQIRAPAARLRRPDTSEPGTGHSLSRDLWRLWPPPQDAGFDSHHDTVQHVSAVGRRSSPLHLLTREMYGAHNSYFGRASKIFSLPLKNFPESRLTLPSGATCVDS